MAEKLPNPKKYTPKPYEQMQYPGQRVQIDVKFVPKVCIVGQAEPTQWYQYTFIDEYSRFRYLEAFPEHSTYSSALFIQHCVKRFPYAIECVQTDNGTEFTNRLVGGKDPKPTLFEQTLAQLGIRHKLIKPYTRGTMGKSSAATGKTMKNSMLLTGSFPSMTLRSNCLSENVPIIIFLSGLSTGTLLPMF